MPRTPSAASTIALNAANFFLAEMAGVILPFLSAYLKQKHWSYSEIGIAASMAGLGTLLFQLPAGVISDRMPWRRVLLAATSLTLGLCYSILPAIADNVVLVNIVLFVSGAAGAFFVPLLATLALSLAGHDRFDRTMGMNQCWNHGGNIASALLALMLVKYTGIASVFFVTGIISILAALSLYFIRRKELDPNISGEKGVTDFQDTHELMQHIRGLLKDKTILALVLSVALFHLANAPIMPLVGLYLKHLGSGDDKVAWVVLVAQAVMVPVAYLAGRYCTSRGRKPVFAIAFLVLPVRIILYTLTTDPTLLLAIQTLDGIGAGIYGVVICLMCGDLTRGKGAFNTLLAVMQTALAAGSVAGPLAQGFITEHLGFPATFACFAAVALLGAIVFLWRVPETQMDKQH